jgi:hypothetical protein
MANKRVYNVASIKLKFGVEMQIGVIIVSLTQRLKKVKLSIQNESVVEIANDIVITCSALALSTVLKTTSLSYGNMPFSGTHPTKTP